MIALLILLIQFDGGGGERSARAGKTVANP
jgi:hypothetical protein